jgi:DNA invertase Pin-like site-specific DNA recombinase
MNKYLVEILNEDGTIKRSETFKNLQEIAKLYNISYHQVRSILNDDYKNKRNVQQMTKDIIKQIRVYDNPESKFIIN